MALKNDRISAHDYLVMIGVRNDSAPVAQSKGKSKTVGAPHETKEPKRNKYGAKKVVVNGIKFDSIAESKRWIELEMLEKSGHISSLTRQVKYVFIVNGTSVGSYIADFVYRGSMGLVVEDVKSKATMTPVYRLKKRLMLACHGVTISEMFNDRK